MSANLSQSEAYADEATNLLRESRGERASQGSPYHAALIAEAQVYATLAQTAALVESLAYSRAAAARIEEGVAQVLGAYEEFDQRLTRIEREVPLAQPRYPQPPTQSYAYPQPPKPGMQR